ncbi:head-tail joining protein [Pandoraea commovens]|uniref:Uncharacterized protein n=1 Tax=Pandoraea commovens TaxID=2508289 RepID=A0ABY5QIH6_9BURK|nr:hypothetical protein [Pandoraea commovens]UVA80464.1 hypothetical protein NTU39_05425 [Pandoraea commovens]
MPLDPSRFFEAFARHGLLDEAVVTPKGSDQPLEPVQVRSWQPDQPILGGKVIAASYGMEYQTADLPNLAKDDKVAIGGVEYSVARVPTKIDNGFFSHADLKK